MSTTTRWTARIVATLLTMAGLFVGLQVPTASAASCTYSGCNGKNPETYGCSADAKTVSHATDSSYDLVELRYSKKCHAVWTRTRNYHLARLDSGYIDYYGHWTKQKSYTSPNGQGWITNYDPYYEWSQMISIHGYERFHYYSGSRYWEWTNSIDGCSDSVC